MELAPDVAVILEAVGWRTRKRGEAIAGPLGGTIYFCRARSGFDLAVITKLPARNVRTHRGLNLFHGLITLDLDLGHDSWLRLHATHLSPVGEERREGEVRKILEDISPPEGFPEVILGDLNTIRLGDTVEGVPVREVTPGVGPIWRQDKVPPRAVDLLAEEGWLDLFRRLHPDEEGYTFPTTRPVARYDYVFGNEAFQEQVEDVEVLRSSPWADLSDHLPLLVTLRPPGGA